MSRDDRPSRNDCPGHEHDSFDAVVREHWTTVYRFLYSATGDAHAAEDLTQETFLRAWNRLDTFQPGTGMRVWLIRIAANAACDVQRRRRRIRFTPLEHDPPGVSTNPGHRLDVLEQAEALKTAMAELTEMTRMVFHLRAQEDLSFREIASLVGTTEQGARWHMHQARTKLLKHLAEES